LDGQLILNERGKPIHGAIIETAATQLSQLSQL
jgi:hypothetical protein